MEVFKEDKWLLSSCLQKSIRRGWVDEALYYGKLLYNLDRAYFSYRLSVMAVEDVGAGNLNLSKWISDEVSWGAKRFGSAKKSDLDWVFWKEVVEDFCLSTKDRTPCNWISCNYFIKEFEMKYGPWSNLDIKQSLDNSYNTNLSWWERGLFSHKVVGTKRFPTNNLPEVDGNWDIFLEAAPEESKKILSGFGYRQREAHTVYFPLVIYDQNIARAKNEIKEISYNVKNIDKCGNWLSVALDKHTMEGKKALVNYLNSKDEFFELKNKIGYENAINVVSYLMFWTEGGVVNKDLQYPTSKKIITDIQTRVLKTNNLNGKWFFDNFYEPDLWLKHRQDLFKNNFKIK